MIDTLSIFRQLSQVMDSSAAEKIVDVVTLVYNDLQQRPTKEDLQSLQSVVGELAEAQKRSEGRMDSLALSMHDLAEAQKRTETRVEELAEAQKRTEARVEELAEVQKQVLLSMQEMMKAISSLSDDVQEIRRSFGHLSDSVGFGLEDRSYRALPALLLRDYGLQVQGRLKRQYITDPNGKEVEVNIFGTATRNGDKVTIIGEGKSQLSQNDIDNFVRRRLKRLQPLYPNIFPVLITYMTSSGAVETYAREQGMTLYFSYDFE